MLTNSGPLGGKSTQKKRFYLKKSPEKLARRLLFYTCMKTYIATTFLILAVFTTAAHADVLYQDEISDGVALYQQHCARCHGKFEKTRIPDRSFSRITSAIKNLGSMGKLKNLSREQIEAISQILKSEPAQLSLR